MMVVALLFTFCLWASVIAAGAGEIVLSQVGNGQWQVNAVDLNNVQALDLQLNYDPQRFSGLTVTSGAALTAQAG
ncbi:MAG: hypothetical protein IBX46_08035 [Desulfuromonadales bacterium]|nr:hypothetical protein [Desulfuromonadales bacterium]